MCESRVYDLISIFMDNIICSLEKMKVAMKQAMKAYEGSTGIALLFL